MSNYKILNLYPHNIRSYEKIKEAFKTQDVAAIIHSTGTGKSYNALQLALDNPDKKIVYIFPYSSILEHLKEIVEKNPNLDFNKDFKNVEFRTYQGLTNLSKEELENLNIDILILDEFHHIGAPEWGKCIKQIIDSHENMKILGMSAYTVRDRGSAYERDMINPDSDELFSNKVVSTYDLADAIAEGVLPKPIYKSAYIFLEETLVSLKKSIKRAAPNQQKELNKLIDEIRNKVYKAPSMKDVFKNNIKKDGKYIFFCPIGSNVNEIVQETKTWLSEMGLTENDYYLYRSTSEMQTEGKLYRNAFYNDSDLENNNINNKLRIMFAINQYNEGSHVPFLDGVIMGRQTTSEIVYYEQLGRALSTKENIKEKYFELYDKDIEELIKICKEQHIDTENKNKEQLIDLLTCPVIIDLANNIDFIKNLENDLKDRVKESYKQNNLNNKREYRVNPLFDIDMLNENLYQILKYVKDRLALTWEEYYMLLEQYYEEKGNIIIPSNFTTINGYDYDPNGYNLGKWLLKQKRQYKNMTLDQDRIKLLEMFNINWNVDDNKYIDDFFEKKLDYCIKNNLNVNSVDDLDIIYKLGYKPKTTDIILSMNSGHLDDYENELSDFDLDETVYSDILKENIDEVLNEFPPKEKDILVKRFGLDGNEPKTLEEIAKEYGYSSGEVIRQHVNKSIRKLRGKRARKLGNYSEEYKIKSESMRDKEKLHMKSHFSEEYHPLVDYIYSNEKERKKQLNSLAYLYLKIKKSDLIEILDLYTSKGLYSVAAKEEAINEIIEEVQKVKNNYSSPTEYLEEFSKTNQSDEHIDKKR